MDKILSIDGVKINGWEQFVNTIQSSPGKELNIILERNDAQIALVLTPDKKINKDEVIGFIGASPYVDFDIDSRYTATESFPVFESLGKGVVKTYDMSVMTLQILGKMIVGEASVKNLSGPISIAQYAGKTAQLGIVAFLSFLAIISISLGVLNLLPVPILDGGHLLYYSLEAIKGSPVSERVHKWQASKSE